MELDLSTDPPVASLRFLRSLRDGLHDESLRVAIVVGFLTIPFTVWLSWELPTDSVVSFGGSVSGEALVSAAVLVGYYYNGRPTDARRAGLWTGLAASIGTMLVYGVNSIAAITAASWPLLGVAIALSPVVIGLGIGFTVLLMTLLTMGTDWVLSRVHGRRLVESEIETDRDDKHSKWWMVIAVYAVLTPVALWYVLWIQPDSGVGVGLSVLLLFVIVTLSIVALLALFIDATTPRSPNTDWMPNVWLYVGGPIAAAAVVYLVTLFQGLDYPPGYGQYGFLIALWIVATVYLFNLRRHRVSSSRPTSAS